MRLIGFIKSAIIFGLLSGVVVADIWKLESTSVPQISHPPTIDSEDFVGILTTYNTYMLAFSDGDFHTMTEQLYLESKSIKWRHKLDAIYNFSFLKTHILTDYSSSEIIDASFISPLVGGHVLFLTRIDKNSDGEELYKGIIIYGFREVNEKWMISSIFNLPPRKSPF